MSKPTDNAAKANQLTTSAGNPIADNQNSLSAGPRGPYPGGSLPCDRNRRLS